MAAPLLSNRVANVFLRLCEETPVKPDLRNAASNCLDRLQGTLRLLYHTARNVDGWSARLHKEISKHLGRAVKPIAGERLETGLSYPDLLSASPSQLQSIIGRLTLLATGGIGRTLAWQKLGICHMLLGNFDAAISHLESSLRENPGSATSHYFKACALLRGGKPRRLSLSEIRAEEAELLKAIQLKDAPTSLSINSSLISAPSI